MTRAVITCDYDHLRDHIKESKNGMIFSWGNSDIQGTIIMFDADSLLALHLPILLSCYHQTPSHPVVDVGWGVGAVREDVVTIPCSHGKQQSSRIQQKSDLLHIGSVVSALAGHYHHSGFWGWRWVDRSCCATACRCHGGLRTLSIRYVAVAWSCRGWP